MLQETGVYLFVGKPDPDNPDSYQPFIDSRLLDHLVSDRVLIRDFFSFRMAERCIIWKAKEPNF